MAEEHTADVAIVGAGIAGTGLAADLAGDFDVVLLEQESRPGYHSTGRSAAIFIQNYGNDVIRGLSRASAPLFHGADRSVFPTPLLSQRGILHIADEAGLEAFHTLVDGAEGMRVLTSTEALEMVPVLRSERLKAAAYEHDAQDIDVDALHQGFQRKARAGGAKLLTNAPLTRATRAGGEWIVETPKATVRAKVLVDAAGAWADTVAKLSGVAPLGIQPMRRSMAVLPAPEGRDIHRWPLFGDAAESWYAKPDAGRLLVSPAEEIPVDPHDAFVDDMVLAEGLYRFEEAVDYPVTRVERSWAGLRSFAPDRTPVAGFDPSAEGFFWLAGQGGYGIQTSPALSMLAGRLIRRATPPAGLDALVAPLSPARFRGAA